MHENNENISNTPRYKESRDKTLVVHAMGLKSKAKFECNCHVQYLRRMYVRNKMKAFDIVLQ